MIVAVTEGDSTTYPDSCPFHATKANGLGVCGHRKHSAEGHDLICSYMNTPREHHNPPSLCPLIGKASPSVWIEMGH